jgi:N-acyl-D-aspartate/D-glutamate deacylase
MIKSVEEFVRLRLSDDAAEQARATHEAAEDEEIWHNVIAIHPELKIWVVHNKTVPLSVLRLLGTDDDPRVRRAVARKRKLDRALFDVLAKDGDESVRWAVFANAKYSANLVDVKSYPKTINADEINEQ